MVRAILLSLSLLLPALPVMADEAPQGEIKPEEKTKTSSGEETKTLSGMSILGNDEAPTSLVIVPWKSSELGSGVGLSNVLNAGSQAVDKDVFMRELGYYEIRSE